MPNHIKLIQITDTHLFAHDHLNMHGVQTNATFKAVIDKIAHEESHDTDAILLTGDISQDETAASYERVVSQLAPLNLPVYWMPGNHDDSTMMATAFGGHKNFFKPQTLLLPSHTPSPTWQLIFLDANETKQTIDYISEAQLITLQRIIATSSALNLAIVMHQHPCIVNTPLVDKYILKNNAALWRIIKNTSVKLIICGHVHGDYTLTHNGVHIETGPATCLQWQKGATSSKINRQIGYKIYRLYQDHYEAEGVMW